MKSILKMSVALPILVWATGAVAQTAASEAGLETIVVTAEKHTTDLQKTSISIASISGDDAMRQGKTQLDEVMQNVGAVKVLEGEDGPTFYIRGVGTGVPTNIADPEINLNIDGVYQSEPEYSRAGLYDVSRVEVLRGPQGTLYGRNAVAGVVNIVTNDPTFDYGAGISVGAGNFGMLQAQGYANIPLDDTLAMRVAFGTEKHDGYLSNGGDDADVQSARVKLLWQPTAKLRIVLAADNTHEGGEGESEIQLSPPGPPNFVTNPAYPGGINFLGDTFKSSNPWFSPDPGDAVRHTNFWSVRGQMDWDLDFGVFTLLPAYRNYTYQCLNCWRSESDQNNYASEHQTTVEARLASEPNSWLGWLAGFYYLDSNNPSYGQQLNPGEDSFSNAPGNTVNDFGQTSYRSRSVAGFGQVTVPLSDWFRLTGGLRYTADKKSEDSYVASETDGTINVCTSTNPPPYTSNAECTFSTQKSWNALTYSAGAEANLSDTAMLYAKVSTGYKSGGFFQGAAPDAYAPEHLTSYELGSKNRFLNDTLQINADVFYYNYRDYQVNYISFINPTSAGIFGINTANAQGAHIYGADIEATWLFTPNDQIDAGIYPLHSRFRQLVLVQPFGTSDYSGTQTPFAPDFSANLGYQHVFDLQSHGALTARIETHLETGSWVNFEGTPGAHQPGHSVSNAFLTYDAPNGKWSVSAFVKNIEDRAVLTNAQSGPAGLETGDIAPPRTYGVQVSAKF